MFFVLSFNIPLLLLLLFLFNLNLKLHKLSFVGMCFFSLHFILENHTAHAGARKTA